MRFIVTVVLAFLSFSLLSQDLIITNNNDSIRGEILYETPDYYQISSIYGAARNKYGS